MKTKYQKINALTILSYLTLGSLGLLSIANAQSINRELQLGMSGADVGVMQTFFAKDPTIYPQGLVTNYFGIMTKGAVMNFQQRNGISTVGRVGPQTLPVLNAAIANGSMGSVNPGTNNGGYGVAPFISRVNVTTNGINNSANISWETSEPARASISYASSPLSMYENENSVSVSNANTVSVNNNLSNNHNVLIQNLLPNTTYYYLINVTDLDGNVSVFGQSSFRIN